MSEGIQLKNVKYKGDYPEDSAAYQNPAFKADEADSQNVTHRHVTDVGEPAAKNNNQPKQPLHNGSVDQPPPESSIFIVDVNEPPVFDDLPDDVPSNPCLRCVYRASKGCTSCYGSNKRIVSYVILGLFIALYVVYFSLSLSYEFGSEQSIRLLWVTCLVVLLVILWGINKLWGDKISVCCLPVKEKLVQHENLISWVLVIILFTAVIIFVFVDVFVNTKKPYNLVSGAGLLLYILVFFIFSVSPQNIKWRAVVWGIGLQFMFACIILRWSWGEQAFVWLGDRMTDFLDYSDAGAAFVFGEDFRHHFFAFKVLPTIIFFSTVISILYYWGVMQVIIHYVAIVMQFAMGTTAGESLNAAGNIFVGQTEAPLMIRPLLPHMTRSELHAVMTGGFATIAGGVLAAYISFGVPANHLLSASVMSAPAALAMAKLLYPETQVSRTTSDHVKKLPSSTEPNFISAASNGASQSIKLVANVAVNLIAFLALLEFVNSSLTWFGHRVGWYDPELTFQLICSYLLWPFAVIMGVEVPDCRRVAELIGVKTFLNEFIAFADLGVLIGNRENLESHIAMNGTWEWIKDDIALYPLPGNNVTEILTKGVISVRSEVISTYALCGFANIGSIGIQLGGLGAMAPNRRNDLAAVAVRAMIAGNVACFLTACIAGLFFTG